MLLVLLLLPFAHLRSQSIFKNREGVNLVNNENGIKWLSIYPTFKEDSVLFFPNHILFIELFSKSFLFSTNYEVELFEYQKYYLSFRVGIAFNPFNTSEKTRYLFFINNGYKVTSFFNVDLGVGFVNYYIKQNELLFNVGIKYIDKSGFCFKVSFTPSCDDIKYWNGDYWSSSFGISLGYVFHKD